MERPVVVGIDIGTTKVCTLIARVEDDRSLRILGVGIEASQGVRNGTIIDLASATQAISRSVEKAERSSGLEIASALVSLAVNEGVHVQEVRRGKASLEEVFLTLMEEEK